MQFKGDDVHEILASKGVSTLYHANSLTTSCTFLSEKGLASRGYVEGRQLNQTPQMTDALDKSFGIWNDVFTDGIDVHYRGGRVKGPNHYGPVLFRLSLAVLKNLPQGATVMVTKKNPYNWSQAESSSDHYFMTLSELAADPSAGGYRHGDFGQHVVIRSPGGILPFPQGPIDIELDDPQRDVNGVNAYAAASSKLMATARAAGIIIRISPHTCNRNCCCVAKYATASNFSLMF